MTVVTNPHLDGTCGIDEAHSDEDHDQNHYVVVARTTTYPALEIEEHALLTDREANRLREHLKGLQDDHQLNGVVVERFEIALNGYAEVLAQLNDFAGLQIEPEDDAGHH
jgi:hypothetical protein